MPKPLVIVESPAKARTIAGYLGADYEVLASIGHIRDLPRSGLAIDVEHHFAPEYVVSDGKQKVVADLRKALKGADELILATDEDREGEAIAWHVLEVLQPKVPVKRMVFHEITPIAIRQALDSPRELDMKLVEAQEARRVLDRLVGYEVSPVLWRRVTGARSAGRVQSVAVRLVVERERARIAFRSGTWFDLEGAFEAQATTFGASLAELDDRRLADGRDFDSATGRVAEGRDVVVLDEAAASGLAERLRDAPFSVASVESTPFTEKPRAPFTTSTLQQEASRKLRFGSARAMAVAQRLYERGYITYMRTDSTNLSEQAINASRTAIHELYGDDYLPAEQRVYRSRVKNAQEAHEAIRPAGDRIRTPDAVARELDADERRLYELIWIRTIACQMVDARGRRMTIRLGATSTGGERAIFRASGKSYQFLGFRRAYVEDIDEGDDTEAEAQLPAVTEGESVQCEVIAPVGHETKPPARYTEASLVKELEERGIGRPSTYAAVIETIQARGYAGKKGTALVPSWTAFAVTRLLEQHFGHLVDYGFTATMEEALDVIARGEGEAEKWLHSFYFGNGQVGLRELVSEDNVARIDVREINTIPLGVDDQGRPVAVRVGRYGPYVQRGEDERASIPPDIAPDELTIDVAVQLIEQQAEGPQALGNDPQTGLPVYVLNGRFGPYVQLGEVDSAPDGKPKRASLFRSMSPSTVTLDEAVQLLSLPRVVGVDPEGKEITAQLGRYGPYLKRDTDSRSLESEEQLFTVTLEQALGIFAQPKRRGRAVKPPLAELGTHPDSGEPIRVLDGRYGPYVTDGTTNATVPRGSDPTALTLDEAVALLRDRAARAPAKKSAKKSAKKAVKKSVKKAVKKSAKKSVKKTAKAAKKTTAKKTAKKSSAPSAQPRANGDVPPPAMR
ncbi:MAG: topoisomerase, partial [Actinomycetota bacterium]|nr:topoisomerase [Actinomycetota bacterium]